MPNTTPVAVELYQRAGDGLVPLLVRASGGDTTDIEALIAAAIKQHNEDPAAHPDIRQAIKDAGGGLVTTPVLTLAARLPIGFPAELGMTAVAGLNGAHVQSFRVTVNNAEPVEVAATDNAATYTFTPTGNAGDTLTVGVTAVDNFGNRSPEATAMAVEYEELSFVAVSATRADGKSILSRSLDDGNTWRDHFTIGSDAPSKILKHPNGTIIAAGGYTYYSEDNCKHWIKTGFTSSTVKDFVITKTGRLIGANGYNNSIYIYTSDDLGRTWNMTKTGKNIELPYLTGLFYDRDDNILVCSSNICHVFTSEGNITWIEQRTLPGNTTQGGYSISYNGTMLMPISRTTGYAILKSTDSGKTWAKIYLPVDKGIYSVFLTPQNTLLVGSYSSIKQYIYRSTDNGKTWSTVFTNSKSDLTNISAITVTPKGNLLAQLGGKLIRSEDDGQTWTSPGFALEESYATLIRDFLSVS